MRMNSLKLLMKKILLQKLLRIAQLYVPQYGTLTTITSGELYS